MPAIMTYFPHWRTLPMQENKGFENWKGGNSGVLLADYICLYRYSKEFIHKIHLSDRPGALTVC